MFFETRLSVRESAFDGSGYRMDDLGLIGSASHARGCSVIFLDTCSTP